MTDCAAAAAAAAAPAAAVAACCLLHVSLLTAYTHGIARTPHCYCLAFLLAPAPGLRALPRGRPAENAKRTAAGFG
jgi:hypothetical protein